VFRRIGLNRSKETGRKEAYALDYVDVNALIHVEIGDSCMEIRLLKWR